VRAVIFVDEALEELASAVRFLERQSPAARDRFQVEVRQALTRLSENPRVGPEIAPGIRKLRLRRFSYNLVYEIFPTEVRVYTVAHHRQEPRQWKARG
jgi:plasmid stabilization system protein ParE